MLGALVLMWRVKPSPRWRALDTALVLTWLAIIVQCLPLPPPVMRVLSPQAARVRGLLHVGYSPREWQALSLDPAATFGAWLVGFALLLIFWSARHALSGGGIRRLVRTIGWLGLIVALLAIVQRAVSPLLIYGVWQPIDRGARPFGPFVNRNHLVAWMLMAIPLAFGYALARSGDDRDGPAYRRGATISVRAGWLIVSSIVMIATIFISLSRSGIISVLAIGLVGSVFARGRLQRAHVWWLAGAAAAALIAAAAFTNVPALLARLDSTGAASGTDRREIWRDTFTVIRDFWPAGIGVGSYQIAMLVYQTARREIVFFNQAHNQYLQFLAEGGLLVCVPAIAAVWTFVSAARRRLEDPTGVYWLRAAALTGMIAVLVQGLWETGLTMPANGVLFAVLAAIAVHDRDDAGGMGVRVPASRLRAHAADGTL